MASWVCERPENIDGPSKEAWKEIDAHLGTHASSLPELVEELGIRQFGHRPVVGDAFCGGGSVPFEAARIGCDSFGSDLSPVAALLTWAALKIIGGGSKVVNQIRTAQRRVYDAVDHQLRERGIEENEEGMRADAYLYCVETQCPECGWRVPLAPSWVIGLKDNTIARLVPNRAERRFEIEIISGVSDEDLKAAENAGTIGASDLVCPNPDCHKSTPITMIRGDRRGPSGTTYGLRMWENDDISPRIDDVLMPGDGAQIVMFTHQDASVWADLALILWASGVSVTAAWCIATETDTAMREGNYVQGTVLLVLRKQTSNETAFLDEVVPQVEEEVKAQLDSMLKLDDQEEPNFGDTDYQLAAYAAALRVLTRYKSIEDIDVAYELSKTRAKGDESPIERVISDAVKTACDHLVPKGFDLFVWKTLTPEERFYLKGLDLESHSEFRTSAYMELAPGFGVRDYKSLLSSGKANQTRLKTASEFAGRMLGDTDFGRTLVRNALFATREALRQNDAQAGRTWRKTELASYWNQRKPLIAILHYLASMELKIPNWREDGHAAGLVAGALENDGI